MTVKVRLTQPSLLRPARDPRFVDPHRRAHHFSTTRRELCLWSAATAGFACILLALTRLGA